MTARAAFIRHGAYRQRDGAPSAWQLYPLTEAGQGDAARGADEIVDLLAELGTRLNPVLHCSPLLRAWQTAEIMAERLAAAGHMVTGLHETVALTERSVGAAANLTGAEIEAILAEDPRHDVPAPGWKAESTYRLPFPGAESLLGAGARVATHVEATAEPDWLTLYIGHGAAFRHAAHVMGALSLDQVRTLSMFHGRPVVLGRESPNRWRKIAGKWKERNILRTD
ncbi:histidine phosphatase family protein [Chachezhania antarctica]|uniref:histidine phosphatase family protein n=1 Tax=Chachezhania antarctica TaxID=2340860 RepID=UPI000EB08824|nr:phosphoglycerate mutase family protein [Chachezhania antarctica]|tara:strand:+ start:580 stop:1254 length:675 start_codon:yes stop_codon:yes gene_type:complete